MARNPTNVVYKWSTVECLEMLNTHRTQFSTFRMGKKTVVQPIPQYYNKK